MGTASRAATKSSRYTRGHRVGFCNSVLDCPGNRVSKSYHRVSKSLTESHRVSQNLKKSHRISQSLTESQKVSHSLTGPFVVTAALSRGYVFYAPRKLPLKIDFSFFTPRNKPQSLPAFGGTQRAQRFSLFFILPPSSRRRRASLTPWAIVRHT